MDKKDLPEIQMIYENLIATSTLYDSGEELKKQLATCNDPEERFLLEDLLTQSKDEIDVFLKKRDGPLVDALVARRPDINLTIKEKEGRFYMCWNEGENYCYRTNIPKLESFVDGFLTSNDENKNSMIDDIQKYFKRF